MTKTKITLWSENFKEACVKNESKLHVNVCIPVVNSYIWWNRLLSKCTRNDLKWVLQKWCKAHNVLVTKRKKARLANASVLFHDHLISSESLNSKTHNDERRTVNYLSQIQAKLTQAMEPVRLGCSGVMSKKSRSLVTNVPVLDSKGPLVVQDDFSNKCLVIA